MTWAGIGMTGRFSETDGPYSRKRMVCEREMLGVLLGLRGGRPGKRIGDPRVGQAAIDRPNGACRARRYERIGDTRGNPDETDYPPPTCA